MSTSSESALSESPNATGDAAAGSYFPTTTPRSSISSTLSTRSELLGDGDSSVTKPMFARTVTVATPEPPVKLDPLRRHFPKPTDEVKLEELLARPPLRYSLGHYVKKAGAGAADESSKTMVAVLQQQRGGDIEDTKRELLRAHEELKKLAAKRR
ncbi:hypothetical protein QBC47DRAFT_364099 [Echria macrotheca]|uniref:Uncharacterized protein n=1 Tax=Echria macrotheca TaxID=438768 RepID=A0AAJ0B4W7_9PEZI|nr:hypothetical protein QBC47DRAFT_364099 [Echria macrotheca]